jgi:hypothetical protein
LAHCARSHHGGSTVGFRSRQPVLL